MLLLCPAGSHRSRFCKLHFQGFTASGSSWVQPSVSSEEGKQLEWAQSYTPVARPGNISIAEMSGASFIRDFARQCLPGSPDRTALVPEHRHLPSCSPGKEVSCSSNLWFPSRSPGQLPKLANENTGNPVMVTFALRKIANHILV